MQTHIDDLVQDCGNLSDLAIEFLHLAMEFLHIYWNIKQKQLLIISSDVIVIEQTPKS